MELDGHTGLEHFIIKKQIFFGSNAFYNSLIVSRGKDVSRMVVVVGGGGLGLISGNLPPAGGKYSNS